METPSFRVTAAAEGRSPLEVNGMNLGACCGADSGDQAFWMSPLRIILEAWDMWLRGVA